MDTWSARPNTSKENDATKASSPKKTEKTDGAKPSPSEKEHASRSISLKSTVSNLEKAEEASKSHEDKEPWQIQKAALKAKFGDQGWSPKRRLSPDALEGIRTLHKSNPEVYTTPALAQEFKVSPEAIRRILRSKWRPTEEEDEDRARRWQKRGEQIWNNMAQMGVRPPKKWRDMGAGRVEGGRSVVAPYKKGGQRLGKDDLRWGPGGFREDMVFKPKAPREEGEEEYGDRIL
ncbi:hypothetical protein K490DRAFT_35284 [Saccharata proteae CBS 121410]|uniref:Required for respiratory growth protein 9, mitochondrial n=1 Tax=Saccharata proteae CBS 121410 TaxID=1314787 RepID=A0A9P4HVE8_9PEZI|nr:hypothetical protein K490DRAFT_35284 [Saccharata proteae CBS 121410]